MTQMETESRSLIRSEGWSRQRAAGGTAGEAAGATIENPTIDERYETRFSASATSFWFGLSLRDAVKLAFASAFFPCFSKSWPSQ